MSSRVTKSLIAAILRPTTSLRGDEPPTAYRGENLVLRGPLEDPYFEVFQGNKDLGEDYDLTDGPLTGALSYTAGNTEIVGYGTDLTNELHLGQALLVNGESLSVKEIIGDGSFIVDRAPIGSFAAKMFVDGDVNTGSDYVQFGSPHGFTTGDAITLGTTGVLPAGTGIVDNAVLYAIASTSTRLKFADTLAHALSTTAINITSASGGGNHYVGYAALRLHQLSPMNKKRCVMLTGNAVEFELGHIVAAGSGDLHVNGEPLAGESLIASNKPKVAIYDPATQEYSVRPLGYDRTPPQCVINVIEGGTKAMSDGDLHSFMIAYWSGDPDGSKGYSNPCDVIKLDGNGDKIKVDGTKNQFEFDFTNSLVNLPDNARGFKIFGNQAGKKTLSVQGATTTTISPNETLYDNGPWYRLTNVLVYSIDCLAAAIDISTDKISIPGHKFQTGDKVYLQSSGDLPVIGASADPDTYNAVFAGSGVGVTDGTYIVQGDLYNGKKHYSMPYAVADNACFWSGTEWILYRGGGVNVTVYTNPDNVDHPFDCTSPWVDAGGGAPVPTCTFSVPTTASVRYIIKVDGDTVKLAATKSLALAGTADDISDPGTGTITIGYLAAGNKFTFEYLDSEIFEEVTGNNDPPADAEFVTIIDGRPTYVSCYGKRTTDNDKGSNPGKSVVMSKFGNPDAAPAEWATKVSNTIIGTFEGVGRWFMLTPSSLDFVVPTGLLGQSFGTTDDLELPLLYRPYWKTGAANRYNITLIDDDLIGFSGNKIFTSVGNGDENVKKYELGTPVEDLTRLWFGGHVYVAEDVKNNQVCFCFSSAYKNEQGYWCSIILPYSKARQAWLPLLPLSDPTRDMIISGVATIDQRFEFLAGGRVAGGTFETSTYRFDGFEEGETTTVTQMDYYLVWQPTDDGLEDRSKQIHWIRPQGIFTNMSIQIHGAKPGEELSIEDMEDGTNSLSGDIVFGDCDDVKRFLLKKMTVKNLANYALRIAGSWDGTGKPDRIDEIVFEISSHGRQR